MTSLKRWRDVIFAEHVDANMGVYDRYVLKQHECGTSVILPIILECKVKSGFKSSPSNGLRFSQGDQDPPLLRYQVYAQTVTICVCIFFAATLHKLGLPAHCKNKRVSVGHAQNERSNLGKCNEYANVCETNARPHIQ